VEDEKTLLLGRGGEGIFCFLQLIDGENPFPVSPTLITTLAVQCPSIKKVWNVLKLKLKRRECKPG